MKEKLKLEPHNFRINSDGWERITVAKISYLSNPENDIYEILEGEYKGEQLFTWDAAMRETKKAGKRMPTIEEFKSVVKKVEDMPNLVLAGYRYYSSAVLNNQGSYGLYWSSSPIGTYAYYLFFNASSVSPANYDYRVFGFSVRCVKENNINRKKGGEI